jgi:hypothetical protein
MSMSGAYDQEMRGRGIVAEVLTADVENRIP